MSIYFDNNDNFLDSPHFNSLTNEEKLLIYDNLTIQITESLESAKNNPYSRMSHDTKNYLEQDLKKIQGRRNLLFERMTVSGKQEKSDSKTSFVHVAPGAKVIGLTMTKNTMIGAGDFIKNNGELEDVKLNNNKHITDTIQHKENKPDWQKWGTIIGIIGILVTIIIAIYGK